MSAGLAIIGAAGLTVAGYAHVGKSGGRGRLEGVCLRLGDLAIRLRLVNRLSLSRLQQDLCFGCGLTLGYSNFRPALASGFLRIEISDGHAERVGEGFFEII
jgi:hypothetical protein